jgi:hypothetical protein
MRRHSTTANGTNMTASGGRPCSRCWFKDKGLNGILKLDMVMLPPLQQYYVMRCLMCSAACYKSFFIQPKNLLNKPFFSM